MDSMVTDLAQREPIAERGQLQSSIYALRFAAQAGTGALVSFGFSSPTYGGSFAWGFTLPQYLSIMTVVGALGLPAYYFLQEQAGSVRKSYCDQFARLYERIKLDAVWRVIAFSFLVHIFTNFSNAVSYGARAVVLVFTTIASMNLHCSAPLDIAKQWIGVVPWIDGLFHSVLVPIVLSFGVWCALQQSLSQMQNVSTRFTISFGLVHRATQKYFSDVSWHKLLLTSIALMSVLIYIPALLIDLGVVRNQFFYVGAPMLAQVLKT